MVIKDKVYWQEYNQKRKVYLQQRYQQRKEVVNSTTNSNSSVVKSQVAKSEPVVENILQPKLEVVKSNSETLQPTLVVKKESLQPEPILQPCSNCKNLQSEVDNCRKRHQIPKDAQFINLLWDRNYKKLILYSCSDICWTGKYCNNCSSLEKQLSNRVNEKNYYAQEN